jgi:hypothetical protein
MARLNSRFVSKSSEVSAIVPGLELPEIPFEQLDVHGIKLQAKSHSSCFKQRERPLTFVRHAPYNDML